MSYQPQFAISPALLARVEAMAALRERILHAAVQVAWIPALQKRTPAPAMPIPRIRLMGVRAGRRLQRGYGRAFFDRCF